MTDQLPPDLDLYAFLAVSPTATEAELRSAFRKQSLIFHPDKNKSPDAEHKFHLLTLAHNVLSTPSLRESYDNSRKAKAAKAERLSKYDDERRRMQKDLEEREREAKRRRTEGYGVVKKDEEVSSKEQVQKLKEENERLKRMRDERIREEIEKADEEHNLHPEDEVEESERTVKVRFRKGVDRSKVTSDLIEQLFSRFGEVENIILGKSALVIFRTVSGAQDAVAKIMKLSDPAVDIIKQVTMAQAPSSVTMVGDEQELDNKRQRPSPPASQAPKTDPPNAGITAPKFSFKPPPIANANGADYESVTLMRMRRIAKEKLEREIREQEEAAKFQEEIKSETSS